MARNGRNVMIHLRNFADLKWCCGDGKEFLRGRTDDEQCARGTRFEVGGIES